MLPGGPLSRRQMKNLKVCSGSEHPHEAQQPVIDDFANQNPKNTRRLDMVAENNLEILDIETQEAANGHPEKESQPLYTKRRSTILVVLMLPVREKMLLQGCGSSRAAERLQ